MESTESDTTPRDRAHRGSQAASATRSDRVIAGLKSLPGVAAVALALVIAGSALAWVPGMRAFDLALLDFRFALLARVAPLPATDAIVIVGIDEATLAAMPEPLSLSHRMLGRALAALATAGPRAVGIDVVLPDRSFDAFAPGADQALISGLIALRRVAPIVPGFTTMADGRARPIHPPLLAAAGAREAAAVLLVPDADGHVRSFDDRLGAAGERVPTLVGELARHAGVEAIPGLIQYASGTGFDYTPIHELIALADRGDVLRLRALFADRIVLIGAVLPQEDRLRQPVPLARWESTQDVPGVLVHAQALRTELAGATIVAAPTVAQVLLLVVAACLWLVPAWRWRIAGLFALSLGAFAISLALLRRGIDLPLGSAARVALTATAARSALEAWQTRRDRTRLKALFGGYVSPAVMTALIDGDLAADANRGRRELALLFADIRGFTAISEAAAPEAVLALLNRYFAAITPVLHAEGATIDNFRGDGLMAIFGAPNALPDPAGAAIRAARAMFEVTAALNRELAADGIAPLAIGVSLACGEAVVGHVGSEDRYNYTAIGDAVNVAARLQDVVKSSGYPLVATALLVVRAGSDAAAGFVPLGEMPLANHAPVAVCGDARGVSFRQGGEP